MEKIKSKIRNLSLRKTLCILLIIIIAFITILSSFTVLIFAEKRQTIMESRVIHIKGYKIDYEKSDSSSYVLEPTEYAYSELTPQNEVKYKIYSALMIILPCLYIIIGVLLVVYLYYKIKLDKPIKELTNGINHLLDYDLDFTIDKYSDDELGKLCGALNIVRQELYDNNKKMWNLLYERKTLTSSISHDLRTPITVIKGYLEYIQNNIEKDNISNSMLSMTTNSINEAVNRLESYVTCIQNIQTIDNIELTPDIVQTSELSVQIENEFTIVAKKNKKKIMIENKLSSDSIKIDQQIVFRILENIIDNAFRFAEKEVKLYISENKHFLEFVVSDDGVGFSEEDLKNATELFYTSKSNSGLFGIGLTISKILCEKHNGEIKFTNNKEKGASVFIKIKKY